MGIPRKTYLTTLDDPRDWPDGDGAFIESLALLTGSVSAALRLAVKILRGCIAAGIVDYDVAAWQALAANDSNTAFGSERGIPGRRNTTSPEQGVPPRRVQAFTSSAAAKLCTLRRQALAWPAPTETAARAPSAHCIPADKMVAALEAKQATELSFNFSLRPLWATGF